MNKVVVYGTGQVWRELGWDLPKDTEIIAYADSHENKCTSQNGGLLFEGKPVYSPTELLEVEFDQIYICTNWKNAYDIRGKLLDLGIDRNKITNLYQRYIQGQWNTEYDSDNNLIHNVNGIRIRERKDNESDSETIQELFVTNCYGMDICHKDTVVIDMGMNIGIASLIFAQNENVKKVYGFEPFKDTYEAAVYNFSINKDIGIKIHPFNCAVFDFDGKKEIPVISEFAGGRVTVYEYIENTENYQEYRKENIEYRDAKRVLTEIFNENEGCHFVLKIDTEGAEFPIFKSIRDTNLLKEVDAIMMEYHGLPNELLDVLHKCGFICISPGNKNIGYIYAINRDRIAE